MNDYIMEWPGLEWTCFATACTCTCAILCCVTLTLVPKLIIIYDSKNHYVHVHDCFSYKLLAIAKQ